MAEVGSDISQEPLIKLVQEELNKGSSDLEHEEDIKQLACYSQSLVDSICKGGIGALTVDVKQKLDNWEKEQVNIAVIGRSGVGKSTFINVIRGDIDPDSDIYSPVGHKETTLDATPYPHPCNKNLTFWDLPGCGTKKFPRETYLSDVRVKFRFYDIYIILSSERFTEDDTWLAEEIHKLHKTFLFVRTKVDSEIDNDRKRLKKKANPQKVVQDIRDDCKTNLETFNGFEETRDLYLIGSLEPSHPRLDFDKLRRRLVDGLPALKAQALLFSLKRHGTATLEAKIEPLRQRMQKIAMLSSYSGAVPLPGIDLIVDATLIAKEARFYQIQLGITKADLEGVAEIVDMPVSELASKYNIKWSTMSFSSMKIFALYETLCTEPKYILIAECIPVIGSIVGGVRSYLNTVRILKAILNGMEAEAFKLLKILTEYTAERGILLS